MSHLVRFGIVGVAGFLVDGGLLQALITFAGWGPVSARLISFPAAVLATWLLNYTFTFASGASLLQSLWRYVLVSLGGASVNFLIYTSLVVASLGLLSVPIVSLAIASIVALAFNFLGSKYFAFRRLQASP
jgi:putative flippase GtrA